MDRGAWWATVHGVAKSQIQLNSWTLYLFWSLPPGNVNLHICTFTSLSSLLEKGLVFQVTPHFRPHLIDHQVFFPSGTDIFSQPFSIFNYHSPDWHSWTFVNMFTFFQLSHRHSEANIRATQLLWTAGKHHCWWPTRGQAGQQMKSHMSVPLIQQMRGLDKAVKYPHSFSTEVSKWKWNNSIKCTTGQVHKSALCIYVPVCVCKVDLCSCMISLRLYDISTSHHGG